MRIYTREEFMKLPESVFYCKGVPWAFQGLEIKGETTQYNDWECAQTDWIDAESSDEATDRLEEMLHLGKSYPIDKSYGRDGCFDDDDLFLVYEADDLRYLIGQMQKAIIAIEK